METVILGLLGVNIVLYVTVMVIMKREYKKSLALMQKQLVKAMTELYRSKK